MTKYLIKNQLSKKCGFKHAVHNFEVFQWWLNFHGWLPGLSLRPRWLIGRLIITFFELAYSKLSWQHFTMTKHTFFHSYLAPVSWIGYLNRDKILPPNFLWYAYSFLWKRWKAVDSSSISCIMQNPYGGFLFFLSVLKTFGKNESGLCHPIMKSNGLLIMTCKIT